MDEGRFSGFELEMRDPGIAWVTFNQPERLNGMNPPMKRDLVEMLLQAEAAIVVDADRLTIEVRCCLSNPAAARARGERARRLVLSQQGATGRTVGLLEAALNTEDTRLTRRAA